MNTSTGNLVASISPVSLFNFGTADSILIRLISDDLVSTAVFSYQLGTVVDSIFTGAASATGEVIISGSDYTAWSGANDDVPALIAAKVNGGLTLIS